MSRDGTRIAWTSSGEGSPTIFVPPWPATIESGSPPGLRLRQAFEGRIIFYDRRGFGRSDWGVEHSLERYADDLEAVADASHLAQITLYAAAAGTFDAVVLAARTPRVERMVLAEPAFKVRPGELRAQRSLAALLDHDFETFWRAVLQFAIGWGAKIDMEELVRYYLSAANPADTRSLLDLILNRADLAPYAPLVQADCMIIHNADDPLMPPGAAAELARLIPRHRLVLTKGSRWEETELANREINRFLLGERAKNERARLRGESRSPLGIEGWKTLTGRETEILQSVIAGATNPEIAASLSLSKATVARHLANVYAKLGVRNRVEATNWANRHIGGQRL